MLFISTRSTRRSGSSSQPKASSVPSGACSTASKAAAIGRGRAESVSSPGEARPADPLERASVSSGAASRGSICATCAVARSPVEQQRVRAPRRAAAAARPPRRRPASTAARLVLAPELAEEGRSRAPGGRMSSRSKCATSTSRSARSSAASARIVAPAGSDIDQPCAKSPPVSGAATISMKPSRSAAAVMNARAKARCATAPRPSRGRALPAGASIRKAKTSRLLAPARRTSSASGSGATSRRGVAGEPPAAGAGCAEDLGSRRRHRVEHRDSVPPLGVRRPRRASIPRSRATCGRPGPGGPTAEAGSRRLRRAGAPGRHAAGSPARPAGRGPSPAAWGRSDPSAGVMRAPARASAR